MSSTEAVRALLAEGRSYAQIGEELGLSKSTISYHANKMPHEKPKRERKKDQLDRIEAKLDELLGRGHGVPDCPTCQEHETHMNTMPHRQSRTSSHA